MSHPPTYTLLPHFHKIEDCTRPLRSEQAAGYNTATREDRPGAGRGLALHYPGTLPGHLRTGPYLRLGPRAGSEAAAREKSQGVWERPPAGALSLSQARVVVVVVVVVVRGRGSQGSIHGPL